MSNIEKKTSECEKKTWQRQRLLARIAGGQNTPMTRSTLPPRKTLTASSFGVEMYIVNSEPCFGSLEW